MNTLTTADIYEVLDNKTKQKINTLVEQRKTQYQIYREQILEQSRKQDDEMVYYLSRFLLLYAIIIACLCFIYSYEFLTFLIDLKTQVIFITCNITLFCGVGFFTILVASHY